MTPDCASLLLLFWKQKIWRLKFFHVKCFETQNMEEEVLQFYIDFKFEICDKFQVEDNKFLVGKKI